METSIGLKPRKGLVVIMMGVMFFLLMVWALATYFNVRLLDFEHYLEASNLIWQRKNPYGVIEFFAPPWFAFVLFPLLLLPENYSVATWILLNLAAVSLATMLSVSMMKQVRPHLRVFLVGLTPILLPGALFCYITGQVTPMVNGALLLAVWGIMESGRGSLIVLGFLFATVKPHVVLFPMTLMVFEIIQKRRWNVLQWTAGLLLILILVAFIFQPDWVFQMVGSLSSGDYRGGQAGLISPGYIGLQELGIPLWVFIPLIVYILYVWKQKGVSRQLFGLAIVANFLIIPYSRSYDYVLFIFPFIILAEIRNKMDIFTFLLGGVSTFILPFTNLSMLAPIGLTIALLLKRE